MPAPSAAQGPSTRPRADDLGDLTVTEVIHSLARRWPILAVAAALFVILGSPWRDNSSRQLCRGEFSGRGRAPLDHSGDRRRLGTSSRSAHSAQRSQGDRRPRVHRGTCHASASRRCAFHRRRRERGTSHASIRRAAGDPAQRLAAARRAAAIDWLEHNLDVRGEDRSYAITVSVGTPDPAPFGQDREQCHDTLFGAAVGRRCGACRARGHSRSPSVSPASARK